MFVLDTEQPDVRRKATYPSYPLMYERPPHTHPLSPLPPLEQKPLTLISACSDVMALWLRSISRRCRHMKSPGPIGPWRWLWEAVSLRRLTSAEMVSGRHVRRFCTEGIDIDSFSSDVGRYVGLRGKVAFPYAGGPYLLICTWVDVGVGSVMCGCGFVRGIG